MTLMLIAAPAAHAQTPQPPDEPTLEDMARAMREALDAFSGKVAPWAEHLGRLLGDPDAYAAPELLPNGDILIRRKPDAPPLDRPETGPGTAPGLDL